MSRKPLALSFALSLFGTAAFGTAAMAEAPRVAVDIAPVHALVARVMHGLGEPNLIIAPGASPHEYRLRPSQAAALQRADLVFWIGPGLTPWLEGALETLARDASTTQMLEIDGTLTLPFREGVAFEEHGDEEHGDEEHGDEEHDHGAFDPHAWLSPDNGAVWLTAIAAKLSAADPDNAETYRANAAAGREELAALDAEISGLLAPLHDRKFVVFHDAYQYFEASFDLPATGAISLSDASDPSPARIAEIQARVRDEGVTCVLSEPQFSPGIVAAVMDGSEAKTGVLDPMGSKFAVGPQLYGKTLLGLAQVLEDCLSQ